MYIKKRFWIAFIAAAISDAYNKIRVVQLEKHLQGSMLYTIISGIVAVSLMIFAHFALYFLQRDLKYSIYARWRKAAIAYGILLSIGNLAYIVMMFLGVEGLYSTDLLFGTGDGLRELY